MSLIPFIPADFTVPERLETAEFRLRMLTVNDVVKDYDAVMSSVDHCKTIWPGGKWPEGLTLEQNLIDLGWHQKEFQIRRSFAYTVTTPSEAMVLGCVYIEPTPKIGYDAVVSCGHGRANSPEASKHVSTPQSKIGSRRSGRSKRLDFPAGTSPGTPGDRFQTKSGRAACMQDLRVVGHVLQLPTKVDP